MSAAPVNFYPALYSSLFPLRPNPFWLNWPPTSQISDGVAMPERVGNVVTRSYVDANTYYYGQSEPNNHYWDTSGFAPSESPTISSFRTDPLQNEYTIFDIKNPDTIGCYASQLIPTSSFVANGLPAVQSEQPATRKQLNGAVTERQQRYHQRHHAQTKNPQATDVRNKARFSATGMTSNYAIVRDTKMSLSSTPSSPTAGSLGNSYFAHPLQASMPHSFCVPQYKGTSSSSCSTSSLKISSSSMTSYSSRSSVSSTPSFTGISPRKRRADDANPDNKERYCRKIADDDVTISDCRCHACITEEVTSKVDDVTILDQVENQLSKRSKNSDDDVIYVSTEYGPRPTNKGRSTRKIKKTSKKNRLRKPPSYGGQISNSSNEFLFATPQLTQVNKKEGTPRYNLRSSAKGRTQNESSQNVHSSPTTTPSNVPKLLAVHNNSSPTDEPQAPRYHTRSMQKKADNVHQHKAKAPETEAIPRKVDVKIVGETANHATSVIRRVSSENLRQLLSAQQPTRPKYENGVKNPTRSSNLFKQKYDVLGVIGVGGGGTVHAGTRKSDGMQVAIKQVPKSKVKRWGRLNAEIVPIEFELLYKASRSGHSGVIRMLDWYERRNAYILVMERPQPVIDLFDYLNQSGALPEATARNIFRQIARAILHCHANGVVHRDIKDENVLLNLHTSEAKLIDFGCGTVLKREAYQEFAGTPEFYPPEWFSHRRYYGRRVDAWSLGVLLYTMLEAEVPFQREKDILECKLRHKHGERLSDSCKHLIAWMLQKDQDKRPTIEEALQHPWLRERDAPIRGHGVNPRKSNNIPQAGVVDLNLTPESEQESVFAHQRMSCDGPRIASRDSPLSPV